MKHECSKHKGYYIDRIKGGIKVYPVKDFSLKQIFECGQCFRWRKVSADICGIDSGLCSEVYSGVAKGKALIVYMENSTNRYSGADSLGVGYSGADYSDVKRTSNEFSGAGYPSTANSNDRKYAAEAPDTLVLIGANYDDFVNIWYDYFDLGTNYCEIKNELSKNAIMREAIHFGSGIRILKQDFFEALISFILSANNRIPMISRTVERYCEAYGTKIIETGYSFPKADVLSQLSEYDLKTLGGGFRCKYVVSTAAMYHGTPDLEQRLYNSSTNEARTLLTRFPGVGDKVACCALLFSGIKTDVFPVDVWVRRIMERLFFSVKASDKGIQGFARETFGKWTGIAQQYLFYYARETTGSVSTSSR